MEIFETPQPVQTAQPKPTNWPKIILAAVLGLGLLAAAACAGYWYGTESANLKSQSSKPQLKTQTQVTPTPTTEPTGTPTIDLTTGWKTYINTKHNYLLKYPPGFTFIEGPAAGSPPEVFQTWDTISFGSSEFGLTVHVNPSDADGNPIVCSTDEECKLKALAVFQKTPSETTAFSGTVFGKVRGGFKYEITNPLYTTYPHYLVFLENGKLWEIAIYKQDDLLDYSLVDQILSTFKFLD